MSLQEKIVADMRTAMKSGDVELLGALRIIVGEMQRLVSATLSDEEVVKLLRKLLKSEQESLALTNGKASRLSEVVTGYIPAMATEEEIRLWIQGNVDFSKFKNKMMAMKDVVAHFGARVDGNMAKKILMES